MKKNPLNKKNVRNFTTLAAISVGMAVLNSVQAETTIGFEGANLNTAETDSSYRNLNPTYASYATINNTNGFSVSMGQSVVGTPDIGLTWENGMNNVINLYTTWSGRGYVAELNFGPKNPISITFTPDSPSYGVLISSFDMDEYSGGGNMNVQWSVTDTAGTLASGDWTKGGDGRDTISTGLTAAMVTLGDPVQLTFQGISGANSYFAIDNLAFDQIQATPTPEPATTALMAIGLGVIAMRIRRK